MIPLSKLQTEIWCFTPEESLQVALRYMGENDFSQIVVREHGLLRLLTVEGVTRWLAAQAGADAVPLAEAAVSDALVFEEAKNSLVFGLESGMADARRAFAESVTGSTSRLYAIILTRTGKRSENPLGIVTPWDIFSPG